MSLALILAASLAPAPAAAAEVRTSRPAYRQVDRSLSDSDRLRDLQIEIRDAYAKGRIDRKTAAQFYYSIERIRRQMILMGMQVGYRQRVRLRARIDSLYARWAERRGTVELRSGH